MARNRIFEVARPLTGDKIAQRVAEGCLCFRPVERRGVHRPHFESVPVAGNRVFDVPRRFAGSACKRSAEVHWVLAQSSGAVLLGITSSAAR
jgi:hypothetical protein